MPENQPNYYSTEQPQLPALGEQLETKLNGIMLATAYNQELFDLKSKKLIGNVRFPPDLVTISIASSSQDGIILERAQHTGLNESMLETRAQKINQFLLELHPTSSEVQESQNDSGKIKELYTKPEVMQGLRLTSFLMDKSVTTIWLSLNDENFALFLNKIQQKQFPPCLTSDKEMARLHADRYRFKVNPTYIPPDSPSKVSARDTFINLCSNDTWGDIRQDIDIISTFNTLNQDYSQ